MTFPATMLTIISSGDHRLMRRVNRWKPPRWIRLWMILATRAGWPQEDTARPWA